MPAGKEWEAMVKSRTDFYGPAWSAATHHWQVKCLSLNTSPYPETQHYKHRPPQPDSMTIQSQFAPTSFTTSYD